MKLRHTIPALLLLSSIAMAQNAPTKTQLTADGRLLVNGQPTFFIGTAPGPDLNLKTPEGGDGWTELASGGINVVRSFPALNDASTSVLQQVKLCMDQAAAHHMYVWPFIWQPVEQNTPNSRAEVQTIINAFKNHSATFFWKFSDEPAWGNKNPAPFVEAYKLVKQLDPNHLIWISQAPVLDQKQFNPATAERLAAFTPAADVFAIDIYPIPAGKHSPKFPNKNISAVGDYTKIIKEASGQNKLVFMILQVFWSGVNPKHNPKNTIVFPTAKEERYMTYLAIIDGANSLSYFGLCVQPDPKHENQDLRLGCNWNFWKTVLKPILAELKPGSELYPALVGPDVNNTVKFTGAPQIEVRCKRTNSQVSPLYIMAAEREGGTQHVTFSGFGGNEHTTVQVLYENRTLEVKGGAFTDTFAEHDVHIYKVVTAQTER